MVRPSARSRPRPTWLILSAVAIVALVVGSVAVSLVPPRPRAYPGNLEIVFSVPLGVGGGYQFTITHVSALFPITAFAANLAVNGSLGPSGAFPSTSNGSVYLTFLNITYRIMWADLNRDGWVDADDYFYVGSTSAFRTGIPYTLLLLMASSGSIVDVETWYPG